MKETGQQQGVNLARYAVNTKDKLEKRYGQPRYENDKTK